MTNETTPASPQSTRLKKFTFDYTAIAAALEAMGYNTETRPKQIEAMEHILSDLGLCRTLCGHIQGADSIKRSDSAYMERYKGRAEKILREFVSLPVAPETAAVVDAGTPETTNEEVPDMATAAKKKSPKKAAGAKRAATSTRAPRAPKAAKAEGDKKPGVIATLITLLQNGGGTVEELYAKLQKKFPDRGEGMLTTVKIQLSRLVKNGTLKKIKKTKGEGEATHYEA